MQIQPYPQLKPSAVIKRNETTPGMLDRETLDLHLKYIDNNLILQRTEESTEILGEIVCLSRNEERN